MRSLTALLVITSAVMGLCFGQVVDGAGIGWWIGFVAALAALVVGGRVQARQRVAQEHQHR